MCVCIYACMNDLGLLYTCLRNTLQCRLSLLMTDIFMVCFYRVVHYACKCTFMYACMSRFMYWLSAVACVSRVCSICACMESCMSTCHCIYALMCVCIYFSHVHICLMCICIQCVHTDVFRTCDNYDCTHYYMDGCRHIWCVIIVYVHGL